MNPVHIRIQLKWTLVIYSVHMYACFYKNNNSYIKPLCISFQIVLVQFSFFSLSFSLFFFKGEFPWLDCCLVEKLLYIPSYMYLTFSSFLFASYIICICSMFSFVSSHILAMVLSILPLRPSFYGYYMYIICICWL